MRDKDIIYTAVKEKGGEVYASTNPDLFNQNHLVWTNKRKSFYDPPSKWRWKNAGLACFSIYFGYFRPNSTQGALMWIGSEDE